MLRAKPIWSYQDLPHIFDTLTTSYQTLRYELLQQFKEFVSMHQNVRNNCPTGRWDVLYLMEGGVWVDDVMKKCPLSSVVLKSLPCCECSLGNFSLSLSLPSSLTYRDDSYPPL